MARLHRPGIWVAVVTVSIFAAACGSSREPDPDASSTPSAGPTATDRSPAIPIFGPKQSYPPVEVTLSGTLPRSADFLGVRFTVEAAHVTNTHPYTIFGEPQPGAELFAVLEISAENETRAATEYRFNDESFSLRTYSGQVLPTVAAPGVYDFGRLEPGQSGSDDVVFGVFTPDVLDGASLLIGRPPDVPTVLPLTAPVHDPTYPIEVIPASEEPLQAGAIAWSVLDGEASLDRPAGVCCPDTGLRADEGELFVTLELRGRVSGSRYGQASVVSDAVRLVVDGTALKAFGFDGKANVPEGQAYDFSSTWLIDAGAELVELEVGSGTADARRMPLGIGAAPGPIPSFGPSPSLAPAPSPSVAPSGSAAPSVPAASPSPSP
jgi:hypothetical protein